MAKYTRIATAEEPSGNGFKASDDASTSCESRVCAVCGRSLAGRRRQTRFCSSSCRAAAYDQRRGRKSHAKKDGDECES